MSTWRSFQSCLWPHFAGLHLLSAETSACGKLPGKGHFTHFSGILLRQTHPIIYKSYGNKRICLQKMATATLWLIRQEGNRKSTAWGLWRLFADKQMLWMMLRKMNYLGLGNWKTQTDPVSNSAFRKWLLWLYVVIPFVFLTRSCLGSKLSSLCAHTVLVTLSTSKEGARSTLRLGSSCVGWWHAVSPQGLGFGSYGNLGRRQLRKFSCQ